jgi:hypothetical protein
VQKVLIQIRGSRAANLHAEEEIEVPTNGVLMPVEARSELAISSGSVLHIPVRAPRGGKE